jgi:hypothetical protein
VFVNRDEEKESRKLNTNHSHRPVKFDRKKEYLQF